MAHTSGISRILTAVLTGSLAVGGLVPARAGIPPPRTVEGVYEGSEGLVTGNAEAHQNVVGEGEVFFRPRRGERSVTIEIIDDNGQDVAAGVFIDRNGNGRVEKNDHGFEICGATQVPVFLNRAAQVIVEIYAGECVGSTTPSVPTSGVVRATFR